MAIYATETLFVQRNGQCGRRLPSYPHFGVSWPTMSCMMRQGVSMYTSLDRFRIKPGKEDLAREWFRYLNDHLAEANATMPAEGAHIESWFLHEESDGLYGYVYVIYDDNDKAVEVFKESENPLDIKHNEYMNACIDYHDYAEMKPAVALGDYSVFRR